MKEYIDNFFTYDKEKQKLILRHLYKTRKGTSREKIKDPDILLEAINEYLKENGDKRVLTLNELDDLLNGASMASVETETDEEGYTLYDTFVDEKSNVEENVEENVIN